MTLSTTTFDNSVLTATQPLAPAEANHEAPEKTNSTVGFTVDTLEKVAEPIADGIEDAAEDQRAVAQGLNFTGTLLGGDVGGALRGAGGAMAQDAADLAQTGAKVGRAAEAMGGLGNLMTGIEAASAAKETMAQSNEPTLGGKILDGSIAAASKVATGLAWPLAAADFVSHGELSNLYKAGGKAIVGIGEYMGGDGGALGRFQQQVDSGKLGTWVPAIQRAADKATSGVGWLLDQL